MEKRITLTQARREFCSLIRDVYLNSNVYVVTHHQKKVAVIRAHDQWRHINVLRTEKDIEKLVTRIKNLLREFY